MEEGGGGGTAEGELGVDDFFGDGVRELGEAERPWLEAEMEAGKVAHSARGVFFSLLVLILC